MEIPPEATLAGFDIRTPRGGAVRPMSQVVAILTPRPRPLCSLGDASLIEPSLTILLASRNTRAAPRGNLDQRGGPDGAIRRVSASAHARFRGGLHAPR